MRKNRNRESFADLDKAAKDMSDVRPPTEPMQTQWEAAKRTGEKLRSGRPRKDPGLKSKIVPISIEPSLLRAIDKYAKSRGMTRSRLVAEGLKLRIKA